MIDWTQVIIGVVGLILTGILIPFVKSKLNQSQLQRLDYWVRYFMIAAETDIQGEKMGDIRKEWVIDQLKEIGLVTDSNEQAVSNLITGLCKELTNDLLINDIAKE